MKLDLEYEELKNYRNEEGYIDLDKVLTKDTNVQREVRGYTERQKDWIELSDTKILVKTNTEGFENDSWSEMISTELAKQAGIECAEYDLVGYKNEKGIISKNICKQGEELITVNELVGTGPTNDEYPDSTDIYYIFDNLEERLREDGVEEEDIDKCMLSLRKQLLFDIYVMETDRHTENISFVLGTDENGKRTAKLSPMYDTEKSLVLYDNPEYMKKIYSDMLKVSEVTNMQEPKICVIPEKEEVDSSIPLSNFMAFLQSNVAAYDYSTDSERIWKETLNFLCEDDRALDYVENVLTKLDIDKAIDKVEERIGAKIPEHVKQMSEACFIDRKEAISYELALDLDINIENKNIDDKEVDIR